MRSRKGRMNHGLSPKTFAEAIGVSESSVKRWVDQGHLSAVKTAGGHRRILRAEALRYIRAHRLPIVRPDRLDLPSAVAATGEHEGAPDAALYALLVEGRAEEAVALLLSLYLDGRSVGSISDDALHPAMARIGELWQRDEAGVVIEHRATAIALSALTELHRALPAPASGPVAVGGAPSGDPYLLGTLAASAVLTAEGYVAVNLGPDTPPRHLARAAAMHSARLVWLSVTAEPSDARLEAEVDRLAAELARQGALLALGGRLAHTLSLPERSNLFRGRTMGELAAFARGVARR